MFFESSTDVHTKPKNQESKSANNCCNCWDEINQPYEGLSGVLGNLALNVIRGLLLSNGEWLIDLFY
jgi:hypothetical protein